MKYDAIGAALAADGLILRGGFHLSPQDGAPKDTGTMLMVGNVGPAMWRVFDAVRPRDRDPLNAWTRSVLSPIAARFSATALYPFDGPPYFPFLAWAKKAEPLFDSPLGILIHPRYGLWHAWRGALLFSERLELPADDAADNPCDSCAARPCLTACPVDAFRNGVYDVPVCADHLRSAAGLDCMAEGCRSRRACPVGRAFRYEPEQAAHHMDAFLNDQSGEN